MKCRKNCVKVFWNKKNKIIKSIVFFIQKKRAVCLDGPLFYFIQFYADFFTNFVKIIIVCSFTFPSI